MRIAFLLLAVLVAILLCWVPIGRMVLDSLQAFGPVTEEIFTTPALALKLYHTVVLALLTTAAALVAGVGFALAVTSSLVPGARLFRMVGAAPLMLPPVVAAMAWTDTRDPANLPLAGGLVAGFGQFLTGCLGGQQGLWGTVLILTMGLFPFVSILTVRALESVDARLWDAARIGRGELRGRFLLLRLIAPDALAGALFVFVFAASEFGVPEYLSVLGKRWYTYPEEIFRRWDLLGRKGEAAGAAAVASSWPLVLLTLAALLLLLRFRARGSAATLAGDHESLVYRRGHLPRRRARLLGALGFCWAGGMLFLGLLYPVASMLTWTEGLATFGRALKQAGPDLAYSLWTAAGAGLLTAALALPLAHLAARHRRGRWVEGFFLLPLGVPAVLLGVGLIRFWHGTLGQVGGLAARIYDTPLMLIFAYTARFLPLALLSLAAWFRRVPPAMEEAALLASPNPLKRFMRVNLPLALPAAAAGAILTFVLSLRELDLAARVPAGNATAINRISNVVHFGGEDVGAALAIMLLLAAGAPLFLYWVITGKRLEVS